MLGRRRKVVAGIVAVATVAAVSVTGVARAAAAPPPFSVAVDAVKAKPTHAPLPGFDPGTTRTIATVADEKGGQVDFVDNELVVMTSDPGVLKQLLVRRGGKVRQTLTEGKIAPMVGYLVQIDPTKADPTSLAANLAKLNAVEQMGVPLSVSSKTGLGLLASAAEEASTAGDTMTVGVNWLAQRSDFASGSSLEASVGPNNNPAVNPYNFNAYNWSYLKSGSVQDIGVTSAWTLMDSVDGFTNKFRIGVVDGGFKPSVNADLPPAILSSTRLFAGPEDPDDPSDPWHGTKVASVAAAVPNNFRGAAGPGGPVSDLSLVNSSVDLFGIMSGLNHAVATGSRIVNMSEFNKIPWWVSFIVLPFDLDTKIIRSVDDVLLFAGAGNSGENVDDEDCFFVCFENAWITPCENSGVLCVGGLGVNSLNKDPNSNYGDEDVDLYAPFGALVGPTPDRPGSDTNQSFFGTSASSPFAAGVAALIWAAKPNNSADSVEKIMRRNFHLSPDGKVKRRVINAYDAVRDAMPATVAILSPRNGAELSVVSPTEFRASFYDDGHGTPTITWAIDGTGFGTGLTTSLLVGPGQHTVTATAAFTDGVTATDSITVNAVNHPPTVHIDAPRNGDGSAPTFGQHQTIPFHATSLDDVGVLPENQVSWRLDGSSVPFATGHNPAVALNASLGAHTVTFVGCDNFGVCSSDSAPIELVADGPNQPPLVQITSPANGARIDVTGNDNTGFFADVTVSATVSDPEGGAVSVVWLDNGTQVATGLNPTLRLKGVCEFFPHTLTAIATDDAGGSSSDSVDVAVVILC